MLHPTLYTNASSVQKRDASNILEQYRDKMSWPENCNVLDVGCGTGDVTRNLLLPSLRSCRNVFGVDMSSEMIDYAAKHFQHPKILYSILDIEKVENPRSMFSQPVHKIFSFYCLHWVKDQRKAFKNIFELLEPNGEMLTIFLAKNQVYDMYEIISLNPKWAPYMQDAANHVSQYQHIENPEHNIRGYLEDVEFKVLECECRRLSFPYSRVELKNLIQVVSPFVKRIPAELLDEYLESCLSQVIDLTGENTDGSIPLKYSLIVTFARKRPGPI